MDDNSVIIADLFQPLFRARWIEGKNAEWSDNYMLTLTPKGRDAMVKLVEFTGEMRAKRRTWWRRYQFHLGVLWICATNGLALRPEHTNRIVVISVNEIRGNLDGFDNF